MFNSELLSGSLLESALALGEPVGGELTSREREELIASLETELAAQVHWSLLHVFGIAILFCS